MAAMSTANSATGKLSPGPVVLLGQLRLWPARRWGVAVLATGVAALLTGVPTDLVPTGLFQRMIPAVWWNYPVWAVSAVLLGLIAATYVRTSETSGVGRQAGRTIGGGVVSVFAIGCPICNKFVVLALGTGGALSYFEPIQPLLAAVSVGLLSVALVVRLRGLVSCRVALPAR